MKKLIIAVIFPWFATIFGQKAMAQEVSKITDDKKETQEITIRKKGDKDVTLNLQITGDKILINGKPLVEFNEDGITINKKKIVIGHKMDMDFDIDNIHFDDFDVVTDGFSSNDMKSKPFLGVTTDKTDDGAKIISISDKSGAEAAGLKVGDIITMINDSKVTGPKDLAEAIGKLKPKDEVKVTYKRDSDKEKTVKATLKEIKVSDVKSIYFTSPDGGTKSFSFPRTPLPPRVPGMTWNDDNGGFNNIMIRSRQKLGIKIQDTEEGNGVKILDVDEESPAATAGIKKDDILTELNGKKITNTDEAREQLQQNLENNNYPVKVKRNGTEMTLNVKIPKKLKTTNL